MPTSVILVTGTPCVGKTSTSVLLTAKLDALYINLTELALQHNLISGKDEKRNSIIVDEARLRKKIHGLIEKTDKKSVVVDGHYAANVVPAELVSFVFVLRRDPVELRELMKKCGFSEPKLMENLAAEILDVCLFDALNAQVGGRTCELDVTGKSAQEIVDEMLDVIANPSKCCVGVVDWLGKLENEGRLDEFLRI
jgi:adenylate kinase